MRVILAEKQPSTEVKISEQGRRERLTIREYMFTCSTKQKAGKAIQDKIG